MSKEKFVILTSRDHVRQRPNMYIGSVSVETVDRFIKGKYGQVRYIPGLNKIIDEIIDNSIDEAIRTNFQYANVISVDVTNDTITVSDNGRGIPQDEIHDQTTNEHILRPVAAWTKTNAGTSFTADRTTIGSNGVGSACSNYFSVEFKGKTWRDGKEVTVHCKDGASIIKWSVKERVGNGTSVTFTPDFKLFGASDLTNGGTLDTIALIEDRLISLQISFPEIKFKFNGKAIKESNIKKYAELFGESSKVIETTENLSFFFGTSSDDGFRTTSYVNGVNTLNGGSYVDMVVGNVCDCLVDMIKKKHKVDVSKALIKNGLTFVLFARNFTDSKYDSQTKERLTNSPAEIKAHISTTGIKDYEYYAKKILATPDIIDPIIEAQLAKKLAAEKRAATMAQKKLKKAKVAKHIAANGDNGMLFITEGDSAISEFLQVRDPKRHGGFPLRGVIMNTWDMKPNAILENKELSELITVLGIDITDPNSVDSMNYHDIAILADADHDGQGHISPLLLAFLYRHWPKLYKEKRVHVVRTPILISTKGKDTHWCYTYEEAEDFKSKNPGYYHRYIKGLASLETPEYSKIINDPVLDTVVIDDPQWFEIAFGDSSQLRKDWLYK